MPPQQRFPMGVPQQLQGVNSGVGGSAQPPFNDNTMSQQTQMAAGFPNMAMSPALQQQRNMLLQARQLELIGLAQNQNYGTRLNPPQHLSGPMGNQSVPQSASDMFPGARMGGDESMRHPSPSHHNMSQPGSINNPAGMAQRPMGLLAPRGRVSLAEMTDRAQQLAAGLSQQEAQAEAAFASATARADSGTQLEAACRHDRVQGETGPTKSVA